MKYGSKRQLNHIENTIRNLNKLKKITKYSAYNSNIKLPKKIMKIYFFAIKLLKNITLISTRFIPKNKCIVLK
jgi:hypothetical protein